MSPYICPTDLNARLSLSILGGGILRSVDLVSQHVAYSGQMLAVHWTQRVSHAALHPNHNHIGVGIFSFCQEEGAQARWAVYLKMKASELFGRYSGKTSFKEPRSGRLSVSPTMADVTG